MNVLDRFLRYVSLETTSDEASYTCPSTPSQKDLGELLVQELLDMGVTDAAMDDNGYVTATIPTNTSSDVPVIAFIAHLDTAPDLTTKNIYPRIISNYSGDIITLNKDLGIYLTPDDFPELLNYIGNDLVVTDGTTLLGADDKAGIAEIMTVVAMLMDHPQIKHGTIKIAFTPDEEIGRGADRFDVEKFGATYAYTVDGGQVGELEYESFNANDIKVVINGRNVHPGSAKNQMINAIDIAHELHTYLPVKQKPQYTEGYEGFFHQKSILGSVDQAKCAYILRDHDREKFEAKKHLFVQAVDDLNEKYGKNTVQLEMKDMYYNMGEMIQPVYEIVEIAKKAMIDIGIEPIIKPIRGGTDGSRLSFMGLPCPNIFAGGHNFHGRHEFIPVQSMEKAVLVILGIIDGFLQSNKNR